MSGRLTGAAGALLALAVAAACGGGDGGGTQGRGDAAATATAESAPRARSSPTASVPVTPVAASEGDSVNGRKERAGDCTPRRLRALFVGTSLTAGLGLAPDQAYPSLIQRMADSAGYAVEVVNAGVSGETSAAALRRADWLFRAPVDIVLLETGANDGLRGLDPAATRDNIRAILGKVRQAHPNARVLLAQMEAPPNLGAQYTSAFRAMFPDLARETGATLVPFLLEGVAGEADLNQPDGIHPNVAGERRVAANVWPSVDAALRALDPCSGSD